jgi:hypothetical protein
MTRPLRVGDRVTATGTVQRVTSTLLDQTIRVAIVAFDGDDYQTSEGTAMDINALTLIERTEPPVGSVVVKDGKAWVRHDDYWHTHGPDWTCAGWSDISDGEVIFTPGGEA